MNRLSVVAVIGSGTEKHSEYSRPLGKWLAENGFHLINGGGGGVMAETARAFSEVENRKGKVIGVIPALSTCDSTENRADYQAPPGYPNTYTEIALKTHLPDSGTKGKMTSSRNHIIVLSADIVLALPGGSGTRSEIELALEYKKQLILFGPKGEWKEFEQHTKRTNSLLEVTQKLTEALINLPFKNTL